MDKPSEREESPTNPDRLPPAGFAPLKGADQLGGRQVMENNGGSRPYQTM